MVIDRCDDVHVYRDLYLRVFSRCPSVVNERMSAPAEMNPSSIAGDADGLTVTSSPMKAVPSPTTSASAGNREGKPVVMSLGVDGEQVVDGDDCEDEEIFACDEGNDEERDFDSIIGVLETIMVSPEFHSVLPKFFASQSPVGELDDHQQHSAWKEYLKIIDAFVDAKVQECLPEHLSLQQVAALIEKRKDEVSEDVMELVTGASMEFPAFLALWKANSR